MFLSITFSQMVKPWKPWFWNVACRTEVVQYVPIAIAKLLLLPIFGTIAIAIAIDKKPPGTIAIAIVIAKCPPQTIAIAIGKCLHKTIAIAIDWQFLYWSALACSSDQVVWRHLAAYKPPSSSDECNRIPANMVIVETSGCDERY